MHTNDTLRRRLTNAGQQMREWERGMIQMVGQTPGVEEAVAWSGYDYADLRAMAERAGVAL